MFLINWFQANALMIFTTLVLIGIPAVIMLMVFTKKPNTNKEEKVE